MLPNPQIKTVTLADYVNVIRKRIKIFLVFIIIIPTTATIVTFTMKPVYRASASILIEKSTPKVTKFEDVYQTSSSSDLQQFYQTQYKILASRSLAERVYLDLRLSQDNEFKSAKDPVAKVAEEISIEPVKNSQMVLVNVEDTDTLRASAIANSLAKLYIQQDIETRNQAAKDAVGFLDAQLMDIKKAMRTAEEALNKYIQDNKMVTIPDVEKKTQSLLEELKQNKAELEREYAETTKRYKEKHPKSIAKMAQLNEIKAKVEQETGELLDLQQKMVQYNLLKKDVDSNQQLYTSLLTRAKETGVSEKIEATNIRIIDPARPPEVPFKPKKSRDIALAILFAAFSGIIAAFFLEYLDASIKTAEHVKTYLELPFFGHIPKIALSDAKTEAERFLICHQKPKSLTTEAYRAVRTAILFASPEDKPLKKILITSSLPDEGKSCVSANLALIFSQLNERVLLIDMDMHKSRLSHHLNVKGKPGLSDFLIGSANEDDIIKTVSPFNFSMIPTGNLPPNPGELLSSKRVANLFEKLEAKFDRIIIDTPPVLTSVVDTLLVANMVDGVVLVVKGAGTRVEGVVKAKNKIQEVKGKIIGVIINNIQLEKEDRYYYYHYYSTDKQST
jgi:polysaccharide biosynthesis transport protein